MSSYLLIGYSFVDSYFYLFFCCSSTLQDFSELLFSEFNWRWFLFSECLEAFFFLSKSHSLSRGLFSLIIFLSSVTKQIDFLNCYGLLQLSLRFAIKRMILFFLCLIQRRFNTYKCRFVLFIKKHLQLSDKLVIFFLLNIIRV